MIIGITIRNVNRLTLAGLVFGEYDYRMSNYLRESHEWEPRSRPRLLAGLLAAAKNGIEHFGERITYELSPDLNADKPVRKRSAELDAWKKDFLETWHSV